MDSSDIERPGKGARPCDVRLVLEPVVARHSLELWMCMDAAREDLRQWLTWVDSVTGADAMASAVQDMVRRRGDDRQWSWVIRHGNQCAGLVSLIADSGLQNDMEVTYWLVPAHRGHGIAGRVLSRVLDHARRVHRPTSFFAHVAEHNLASAHVLARHGFTPGDWLAERRTVGDVQRAFRLWRCPG